MANPLPAAALDQLFYTARTPNDWVQEPSDDATLYVLYDLLKWDDPTSVNSSPARFAWVRSPEAKAQFASAEVDPNIHGQVKLHFDPFDGLN